jgi:hypothetical protein
MTRPSRTFNGTRHHHEGHNAVYHTSAADAICLHALSMSIRREQRDCSLLDDIWSAPENPRLCSTYTRPS